MGPFEVTAAQVTTLGLGFAEFVSQLLEAEAAAEGLHGRALRYTADQNLADGGVDATTRDAAGGDWIPPGDTAWQFKAGDLSPAACANELEVAVWAHEFLRTGGHYVLALGRQRSDKMVVNRQRRAAQRAIDLGLISPGDERRILVYEANALARWASRFPAIGASRMVGGPGRGAMDFETWSRSNHRASSWTADEARREAISDLKGRVTSSAALGTRVEGESGIGKTRLVLEALDDDQLRSLVAYIPDESRASAELLAHLSAEDRTVVLVVDDCEAERHGKLADQLPRAGNVRLITIGPSGPARSRAPVLNVQPLPDEERRDFLRADYPHLRSEARLFIAAYGEGNMKMTILLANAIARADEAQAAELIEHGDIRELVEALLPESADFFSCAILALLDRIGFDRDRSYQLEAIAHFARIDPQSLRATARTLQSRDLLDKRGRYRAVRPRPLAVWLATEAWRELGPRIIDELLPTLDREMAVSLFTRVADLGYFPPAQDALRELLTPGGPFSSLEAIEADGSAELLTQVAIVLPDDAAQLLSRLIAAEPLSQLVEQTRSRRDLVWTLEKLVWHETNFENAADALLRLAAAENETYANNASGTWVDLFGASLPGTAARPAQRSQYLKGKLNSEDPAVRRLVIEAAVRGLRSQEAITVSGELQGGVLVAPRGRPVTGEEFWDYRLTMFRLLCALAECYDAEVAKKSEEALLGLMLTLLQDPRLSAEATDYFKTRRADGLHRVREQVQRLRALYSRGATEPDERPGDAEIRSRLAALEEALPPASRLEDLRVTVSLARWDFAGSEFQEKVESLVSSLSPAELDDSFRLLNHQPPGAWELGHSYATRADVDLDRVADRLSRLAESDVRPLVGFLWGLRDHGDSSSFARFLRSATAMALPPEVRVAIAVRGPATASTRKTILREVAMLPVVTAAHLLFGWNDELTADDVLSLLDDWLARTQTQEDYNALVSWIAGWLHQGQDVSQEVRERFRPVVGLRLTYPAVRPDAWQWARIAERLLPEQAPDIAGVLLDLVDEHQLMLHDGDQQARLLAKCFDAQPVAAWHVLASRLAASWRIRMDIREWLLPHVPTALVLTWIGDDRERARIIASITPVDEAGPSEVVAHLLTAFPDDAEIRSSLYGTFTGGSWTGKESARLEGEIEGIARWRRWPQPPEVRAWASEVLKGLRARLDRALEEEAERGF